MELPSFVKVCLIITTAFSSLSITNADERKFTRCSGEMVSTLVVPTLQDMSLEIQELRKFQKIFEGIIPGLTNLLPMLTDMSSEIQQARATSNEIKELVRKFGTSINQSLQEPQKSQESRKEVTADCPSDGALNRYVTSPRYVNTRMTTSLTGVFPHLNIPKKSMSPNCVLNKCSDFCGGHANCHAFNFFETNTSYVCEFVADNLCLNKTKLAFVNWPGGSVWEKKTTSTSQSCIDAKFNPGADVACEVLRPGCLGTWPNCMECLQSCVECSQRYSDSWFSFATVYECTIWPEYDTPYSYPIESRCSMLFTHLISRAVNVTTTEVTLDYRMSFHNINRLSNMKAHPKIFFWFETSTNEKYWFVYENWAIDAEGTLRNMTFHERSIGAEGDIFNLNGAALKPTPFVMVENDFYGCGSFWVLDPKNATDCPGGKVNMLGRVQLDNGRVVSTGMSSPQSILKKHIVSKVFVLLGNI